MADILDSKTVSTEDGPAARVLVGMVAPADSKQLLDSLQDDVQVPKPGSDVHDLESALVRRDQLVAHLRTQLMRGLATSAGQATLQTLKQQLRDDDMGLIKLLAPPLKESANNPGYIQASPRQDLHIPCAGGRSPSPVGLCRFVQPYGRWIAPKPGTQH